MERTYTVNELLGAMKRRWKWMAVVAGAVFAVAALVVARLPSEYRARALVGDLVEGATLVTVGDFTGGVRLGVYRNSDLPSQFQAIGSAGYSGEVSLEYRVGREWTVAVAGLRDARLDDRDLMPQVDRDVVQLRLTWERFRPF